MDKNLWVKGTGLTWSQDVLDTKIDEAKTDSKKATHLLWSIKDGAGYDDSSDAYLCAKELMDELGIREIENPDSTAEAIREAINKKTYSAELDMDSDNDVDMTDLMIVSKKVAKKVVEKKATTPAPTEAPSEEPTTEAPVV